MSQRLDLRAVGLVALGGAVGAGLRALLIVPLGDQVDPLLATGITLAVNLLGSFLLGIVVARLTNRALARAFFGTGILGGFTTYSAFAVQTIDLFTDAPVVGILYAAVSILGGALLAVAGLQVGRTDTPDVEPEVAE